MSRAGMLLAVPTSSLSKPIWTSRCNTDHLTGSSVDAMLSVRSHATTLHRPAAADHSSALPAQGIIELAKDQEVDCIHPGYGFLSENSTFARRCAEEGITFIGPRPDTIAVSP
jgi:acetyl/propionyl-CoA carboxylase alpha subunit